MFNNPFYHMLMRKYNIYIGSIFSDIFINRYDKDGIPVETIKVPLSYSPKEKFLARVEGDKDLTKPIAIQLPRIGFNLDGMQYDADRKLNTTSKIYKAADDEVKYIYQAVPYNLNYSVYIMMEFIEDGAKIVEQILPYFTPEWTAKLNLVPEMSVEENVPIILNSVDFTDTYEGAFQNRRTIIWDLKFTMKAWFYGPVTTLPRIKQIYINFKVPTTNTAAEGVGITDTSEQIYIQPGLTANGEPTSNISLSIPPLDINYNDNWDYVVVYTGKP